MARTVPHTGPYDADFDDPAFDLELAEYEPDKEERTLALMAHLAGYAGLALPFGSVLGPALIYWLKRDESAYVEDQAREALNFQITLTLVALVAIPLVFVIVGVPILLIAGIWYLVGTAIGASKANDGEWYRYPATIRLVKG